MEKIKVTRVIAEAGKPNKNGRIYSAKALKQVEADSLKRIKSGTFLGETGPTLDTKKKFFSLDISKVSHRVTDVRFEEDTGNLVADIETLETKNGAQLASLIDLDGYGFAIRGFINPENGIVDYCSIVSFDFCKKA